jgi:hypothetical protein
MRSLTLYLVGFDKQLQQVLGIGQCCWRWRAQRPGAHDQPGKLYPREDEYLLVQQRPYPSNLTPISCLR